MKKSNGQEEEPQRAQADMARQKARYGQCGGGNQEGQAGQQEEAGGLLPVES